jgi:DNA-binding winged helix-turn-helix (wHTH) protein
LTRNAEKKADSPAAITSDDVIVNPERFTVEYRGKTCPLGNTKGFRLINRLHRARGNFVSYRDLVADVWDGYPVSDPTIHQTVKGLRKKLRDAGLSELDIQAQPGHYSLRLRHFSG